MAWQILQTISHERDGRTDDADGKGGTFCKLKGGLVLSRPFISPFPSLRSSFQPPKNFFLV